MLHNEKLNRYVKIFILNVSSLQWIERNICHIFMLTNSRFVHESKVQSCTLRPPYANGRREGKARSTKKSLPSGSNTFQRAAPEFHDRVSGQQHVGTQPWGLPVLGPCQWHRPYRARSRSNRAHTSADGGARGAPSPVEGTLFGRGPMTSGGRVAGPAGGRRGFREGTGGCRGERGDNVRPRRSKVSGPKCHPIPVRSATSFLRVLTHINTRYVYTGTTPVFSSWFSLSILL